MSSPDIDLDMNLLNSPVPPSRGRGGASGNEGAGEDNHRIEVPSGVEKFASNDNDNRSLESFSAPRVKRGDVNSRSAIEPTTTRQENSKNDDGINDAVRPKDGGDDKSVPIHEDVTRMVESWREELYMMNVKNSILLDDLVKLGANV
eukprot:CAMPEP_0183739410 /NCGR_PEP_ID=MMETSP0737-20130205/56968_1 /TAXON_ID=385413 /ORGANISM="Thalassiosira miniscula, Strain CCMP1093" /LENGTH=146 /DNA_ID=CAMNT_0025974203 /DNA_START=1 /DNA_END=441 /DNA_ORIENTATION=+